MSLYDQPTRSFGDGRKVVAVGGTAERLVATGTTDLTVAWVTITAETDNTGLIVVGGSTVVASLATRRGTPLAAGQAVSYGPCQLSTIFLDTTVNTDGVTFTYGLV